MILPFSLLKIMFLSPLRMKYVSKYTHSIASIIDFTKHATGNHGYIVFSAEEPIDGLDKDISQI